MIHHNVVGLHSCSHALRDLIRQIMLRMRKVDHELFPAITRQDIGTSNRLFDGLRCANEHFIPDDMSVAIINRFEVIDIEQQE
ncbi:hypothetical protein D3C76_1697850 [compost metagenome]